MADVSQRINPFCTLFKLRRFDDSTLRILDVILTSRDSKSLLELRRRLKDFLRSESLIAIREASDKPVDHKLLILDFLVSSFAVIDDVESCLAVRYEALVMRDSRTISHPELRVSCSEWMNFARDAFENGFYSVASKACENALLFLDVNGDAREDYRFENGDIVDEIERLKDTAVRLSATHSVQVQAAEYLKKKSMSQKKSSVCKEDQYPASTAFRNGLKQHNVRNLRHLQNLQPSQGCSEFQC